MKILHNIDIFVQHLHTCHVLTYPLMSYGWNAQAPNYKTYHCTMSSNLGPWRRQSQLHRMCTQCYNNTKLTGNAIYHHLSYIGKHVFITKSVTHTLTNMLLVYPVLRSAPMLVEFTGM